MHGGVLRPGVYARLHHHDGVILKVEMRKSGKPQANGIPTRVYLVEQLGDRAISSWIVASTDGSS